MKSAIAHGADKTVIAHVSCPFLVGSQLKLIFLIQELISSINQFYSRIILTIFSKFYPFIEVWQVGLQMDGRWFVCVSIATANARWRKSPRLIVPQFLDNLLINFRTDFLASIPVILLSLTLPLEFSITFFHFCFFFFFLLY